MTSKYQPKYHRTVQNAMKLRGVASSLLIAFCASHCAGVREDASTLSTGSLHHTRRVAGIST